MPKKKRRPLKPKPPALVRSGNVPFTLSLKELHEIPLDKYIQKTVIIKYWQDFPDIFEGEISCIGSKMQIRLQHINCLYINDTALPNDFHHSYWFHFKNIKSIHYNNKDITNEILDIMKYKMIQSFLFYCSETCSYENTTEYIQYLENEYITKILEELSKDPSNHELYSKCHIPQIFEMALQNPSRFNIKHYRSSEFENTIKQFLYDMNRINNHLLLKRKLKNKQRISSCFEMEAILRMLDQYKFIIIQYVKELYGINNITIKKYEKYIKENVFDKNEDKRKDEEDEKNEEDQKDIDDKSSWSNYIDWDKNEVKQTVHRWKLYERNKNYYQLYNTDCWSNEPTKLTKEPKHLIGRRKKRRGGGAKNHGLDNKWLSLQLDKKWKNRHSNPLHHGKNFKRKKKLHKKRNRIDTEKETMFRFCRLNQ